MKTSLRWLDNEPLSKIPYTKILAVAQWECWIIHPRQDKQYPQKFIHTDWLSTCSGLAMCSSKTGAYWLAHLDDGLNIPATIYLLRERLFDIFYLYGDAGSLDDAIKSEIKTQGWDLIWSKYNGYIDNLRLDIQKGAVYRSDRIDTHPRMQTIKKEEIYPISMYNFTGLSMKRRTLEDICLEAFFGEDSPGTIEKLPTITPPPVIVTPKNEWKDVGSVYTNFVVDIYNRMRNNPEFSRIMERWRIKD